jgi:hypothetical protein
MAVPMPMTQSITPDKQRRLLLHLKCLFWCLHQMQTRYDLNLVLYSLEHQHIHPEIENSNLGDNVKYVLKHLETEDLLCLSDAMSHLPDSVGSQDILEKHLEMGHYVQTLRSFNQIRDESYGIITSITPPQLRGLFYTCDGHLVESPFAPSDVRVILGTYVV